MPSLLPGYEYDIFISYRQKDNKYDGWVTEFAANLKKELEATFKEDVSIYIDENSHDGLLETHDVDDSLKDKLRCLIFIPIISRTYCDPKSFAWNNEFLPFIRQAQADSFGLKIKLPNGNTASRVLPIRIHELSTGDKKLIETELQGPLRAIDFTLQGAGVNRPLRPKDDDAHKGQTQNSYRDQINKTANAIQDIISGLQGEGNSPFVQTDGTTDTAHAAKEKRQRRKWNTILPRIPLYRSSLALIAAILSLVTLAILHLSEPASDPRTYRMTILPPENTTFNTTWGGHFALSPDGRTLAFVTKDSSKKAFLWVRPLRAPTGQILNGTDGAEFPFWSPDNRFLGFFANAKLKKIDITGGTPQVLCDASWSPRGGTWSETGTIVFSRGSQSPLFSVSAGGGSPRAITKVDPSQRENHTWPFFLPDGKHFLYSVQTRKESGFSSSIFLASVDTTFIPRLITSSGSNVEYANDHLLYGKDQMLMAQPFSMKKLQTMGDAFSLPDRAYLEGTGKTLFSASRNGLLAYQTDRGKLGVSLGWHDRKGRPLGTIHQPLGYTRLRLSPDGRKIAIPLFDKKTRLLDIWLYDVDRPKWVRLTFDDTSHDGAPVWSPDGSMIAYTSSGNLKLMSSSGAGGEVTLLNSDMDEVADDWSRDGKFIVYKVTGQKSYGDIWILPMSPDLKGASKEQEPYPFLQTAFDETNARISPDNRWMAYESNESGNKEIYIRPFPGPGSKWQVSANGGQCPQWRRDGKELFFVDYDRKMMAAKLRPGSSTMEIDSLRTLFQFSPYWGAGMPLYEVTGDGQRFLISTQGVSFTPPITVVVNWPAELKR